MSLVQQLGISTRSKYVLDALQATAKKMGEHLDEAEIKNLLYGGIDGKGTLAPGFEVDALFDTLYSSTEPLALRTWQLGERAKERVTAEERERKYGIHWIRSEIAWTRPRDRPTL